MAEVLVPATRRSTIGGERVLAVADRRAWNKLPVDLRLSRTFSTFKTHLKSHLFNISFPSVWLYHWLFFLYRPLAAACAAYASLSLYHYITLQMFTLLAAVLFLSQLDACFQHEKACLPKWAVCSADGLRCSACMLQILDAVNYCHDQRIMHRDLKVSCQCPHRRQLPLRYELWIIAMPSYIFMPLQATRSECYYVSTVSRVQMSRTVCRAGESIKHMQQWKRHVTARSL